MNEKEVAELRRRFRQDRSGISHVRGCYVNENREIVSQFDQPLGVMTQEENEKILGLLKRTPVRDAGQKPGWTSPSQRSRWSTGRSTSC